MQCKAAEDATVRLHHVIAVSGSIKKKFARPHFFPDLAFDAFEASSI